MRQRGIEILNIDTCNGSLGAISPGIIQVCTAASPGVGAVCLVPIGLIIIILIAKQRLFFALPGKGVIQLSTATTSRGTIHSLALILILDHLKVIVVTIVAKTSASLDLEIDSEPDAESDD
jgi:hypothetical protein